MDSKFCQEHPGEDLVSICIAQNQHQCNKKLCTECIHQFHQNIGNELIIPYKRYQQKILQALQQKEEQINNFCNEKQFWLNLTKTIEQQFQNLIREINLYKDFIFNKFQQQVKILQNSKKDIETRSILQFSNAEIINLSAILTSSKAQIQEQVDSEVQYLLSKSNRELIENKFINVFSEVKQSIQLLMKKRQDDELIQSLKSVTKVQTDHSFQQNVVGNSNQIDITFSQASQQFQQKSQSPDLQSQQNGFRIKKNTIINSNIEDNFNHIKRQSPNFKNPEILPNRMQSKDKPIFQTLVQRKSLSPAGKSTSNIKQMNVSPFKIQESSKKSKIIIKEYSQERAQQYYNQFKKN